VFPVSHLFSPMRVEYVRTSDSTIDGFDRRHQALPIVVLDSASTFSAFPSAAYLSAPVAPCPRQLTSMGGSFSPPRPL